MKRRWDRISEGLLVVGLSIVFLIPLALAPIRNNPKHFGRLHPWIANYTIGGLTIPPRDIRFSLQSALKGDFQKSKADRFNLGFPGREGLIRLTNEVWLRLFHDTATPTSSVALGRNDTLFEKAYLREYWVRRTEKRLLAPFATKLRRLEDECRKVGVGFVVVVSPSKASIYPEDAPLAWQRRYDPRPRAYEQLVELFRENNISFVDGPALFRNEKSKSDPSVPLFPKGGTHWNSRGALLVANATLERLREQKMPLEPIDATDISISYRPEGPERDLLDLINLARDWRYPCERVAIKPTVAPRQLSMSVVGGSFIWELARQLSMSEQFSEIDFFYYYRLYKSCLVQGRPVTVRTPAIPLDFASEIFAADCLLLEMNEQAIPERENHLSAFVDAALSHLPDPSAARPAFRREREAAHPKKNIPAPPSE